MVDRGASVGDASGIPAGPKRRLKKTVCATIAEHMGTMVIGMTDIQHFRARHPGVAVVCFGWVAILCWAMAITFPPVLLAALLVIPLAVVFLVFGVWIGLIGIRGR